MEIWSVLLNSLLFLFVVALLFLVAGYFKKKQSGSLKFGRWGVRGEEWVRVTGRKVISTRHSLIELEWRGVRYFAHLSDSHITIIDQEKIEGDEAV